MALHAQVHATAPIEGFEAVQLKLTPPVPEEFEVQAGWSPADYARASSALIPHGLLDRALLYLRTAAGLSDASDSHRWLDFGRLLVAMASGDPPYPMAANASLIEKFAGEALASAARIFGNRCMPTGDQEFKACKKTNALARDVLAELCVANRNLGDDYVAP